MQVLLVKCSEFSVDMTKHVMCYGGGELNFDKEPAICVRWIQSGSTHQHIVIGLPPVDSWKKFQICLAFDQLSSNLFLQ